MKKCLVPIALLFIWIAAVVVAVTRGDEWDKKTIVTFNEPVQVPGTVLPAGAYVFKVFDSQGDRHIVQIFNTEETQVIATVMAIPDYRPNPTDKTAITFDERPVGQPLALQSWFYPGDNYGLEFVYPKQKATELAQFNKRPVLSVPDETTTETLKAAPVTRVSATPAPAPKPAAEVATVTTESMTIVEEQLPQTASPLPLVALLGVLGLAAAIIVGSLVPRLVSSSARQQ